jgi:hypothetical protein
MTVTFADASMKPNSRHAPSSLPNTSGSNIGGMPIPQIPGVTGPGAIRGNTREERKHAPYPKGI